MYVDFSFADGYCLRVLRELPNSSLHRYYFPPSGEGGLDGLLLEVKADGFEPWIGQFAFGHLCATVSGVFTLPKSQHFAVVARGAGYVVDARKPAEWTRIEIDPVCQIKFLRHERLVLFGDWTRIAAFAANGLEWISDRLCWDDLRIVAVEGHTIVGCGHDPTSAERPTKTFRLDVRTGSVLESEFDTPI